MAAWSARPGRSPGPSTFAEAGAMTRTQAPRDVLVVGWYPGADDPIAGRFIADQAAALLGTGRVRPLVASFEPFWLHGDRALRGRVANAWPAAIKAAVGAGLVPATSGAFGPAGVPIARLGVPVGRARGIGADNEAVHRERTLLAALGGLDRRVDLIHAHVGYPDGAAAARVAARLGLPFVMTEHATYLARLLADPAFRARYREAGLAASRVIAVGRMLADQLQAELPELADRLVVIPNTVDVASFPLVDPASRDGNELLWVGYRREVKGMDVLLQAFAQVRAARPATTLRLVGRSTSAEEELGWTSLAAELGVSDAVHFDPPTDRAGVAAAMSRAAVFVHPSRRETFGIVAAEALATGLPVVAADSGGVTEVMGDDPAALGALVPSGAPEAMARAILDVLDRRRAMDPAGMRAHVELRYGGPAVAGRIADVYDEAIERGPRAASGRRGPAVGRGGRIPARTGSPAAVTHGPASTLDRPLLVAFDRPALDRLLGRLPSWLLADLIVATSGAPIQAAGATVVIPPGLEAAVAELCWVEAGGGLRGLVRSPLRWLRRGRRRAQLRATVLPVLAGAVEEAIAGRRSAGASGTPVILCLGGVDVAAALPVVEAGWAMLAPGGVRWLGDRRWSEWLDGHPAPGMAADPPTAVGLPDDDPDPA